MPIRIYVAPQIGSGMFLTPDPATWADSTGPYRSKVHKYISGGNAISQDLDHPARNVFVSCVDGVASVHDAIDADATIIPLMNARVADQPALTVFINSPFTDFPLAWRNAARTRLEGWGIDTSDITGSDTLKTVIRRLIKMFSVAQVAHGSRLAEVKNFLTQNIDQQVSAIPVAQRQAIGSWLNSKGIDTSWITGTTTVRQVVNTLPGHFNAIYGKVVTHRFAGEDF